MKNNFFHILFDSAHYTSITGFMDEAAYLIKCTALIVFLLHVISRPIITTLLRKKTPMKHGRERDGFEHILIDQSGSIIDVH